MSKLIRVNINLDNSHSLTDFPVDIYSGTTTGNTTNLVYAGVTTSPVTFTVDDSIMEFGLKLVSTGCLDQVLLIESPSVDCEICADFVEFFDPAPTPQTTQTVLESCINDLTFVVEYNNSALNGSPCSGGHGCNRAVFDILANNVVLGQVNLNNAGGIHDDVNRPPSYPNYPGASSGDRYNALSITSQQAQSIAANSPNGLIDFSFDCACIWSGANQNCVGSSCHTDVSWVRIIKDMGLPTEEELYNGCPNGNFIEDFDPCPPQPTPQPTPNTTPNATPDATPNATPNATPLPTDGSTPQPTPDATPVATPNATPAPTPNATPAPTPQPTPSPTTEVSALTCNFVFVPDNVDTTNQGLDYFQGGETAILTPFSNILATPVVYQGVSGSVYGVCSQTTPLWFDFGQSGGGAAVTDPSGVERPPIGGSCTQNRNCTYEQEPSPTPQPTPEATAETTEISAILLSNTTSAPNSANCDEGNDGLLENRVFVLYNTAWFTTNAAGKNVVKSTFSLTDNEIINGGDSSYTIHPDSIWTGGPSVFRDSSDGTYMIADSSTDGFDVGGTEKLLFQKNGNYGTTNKCGGGPGGFN